MMEVSKAGTLDAAGVEAPHGFLRRVTRPWHDGVEQALGRFDLQSVDGLRGFLVRQAMALMPLETALEAGNVEAFLADWPLRRRAPLIAADLAHLGATLPTSVPAPRFGSATAMLGALYVLEGSKLGGRVLLRQVLASSDPRVRAANAFLGHRHDRGWPSFLALLDSRGADPGSREALVTGARIAFAAFRSAAETEVTSAYADELTCFHRYHPAHA